MPRPDHSNLGHPTGYGQTGRYSLAFMEHWTDIDRNIGGITEKHRGLAQVVCQCYADLREWEASYRKKIKADPEWKKFREFGAMMGVKHKIQDQYLKAMKLLLSETAGTDPSPPGSGNLDEFLK